MVLRQPAGDVLAILISRGEERGICTASDPDRTREAIRQIEGWGFGRFAPILARPCAWEYRITALGRAAHAWGWAEVRSAASRAA